MLQELLRMQENEQIEREAVKAMEGQLLKDKKAIAKQQAEQAKQMEVLSPSIIHCDLQGYLEIDKTIAEQQACRPSPCK